MTAALTNWIAMAVLAVIAVWVIARPWLSAHLPRSMRRRSANVAAYRTRLTEIDADLGAGLIGADAATALKEEQARRLLDAEPTAGAALKAETTTDRRRGVGLALALLPVLLAGVWYLQTGSWRTAQEVASGNVSAAQAQRTQVTAMVARLRQQLKDKPGDDRGWALLGRSELVLENYAASAAAYARANQISGNSNPDWLVGEGQSLALAGGHDLQGRPAQLFAQALKIAPDDPRALWYGGLVAAQAGDRGRARKLWQTLADQKDVPADVRAALEHEIEQLDAAATAAPPGPMAAQSEPPATAATPVTLHLQVRLAPSLASQMPDSATLYVYAKAASGPPMPLAVQRIQNPKLPLKLTLDDSMGVMPTAHLSDFNRWIISARLSKSGNAQPQSGDLQGQVTLDRDQAGQPLTIVIDRRVP